MYNINTLIKFFFLLQIRAFICLKSGESENFSEITLGKVSQIEYSKNRLFQKPGFRIIRNIVFSKYSVSNTVLY